MRFSIISEIPGRTRLQLAGPVPESDLDALLKLGGDIDGVHKVRVYGRIGQMALEYDEPRRASVLDALGALDAQAIADAKTGYVMQLEPRKHKLVMDLATLVGAHYARRWFLPTPLRAVFVVAGYMAFLRAALHELVQPRLTVPVLDASAIGISFVKRDVDTAGQTMFLLNVGELLEDYTRATCGAASVSVPVLSNTMTSACAMDSKCCEPFTVNPAWADWLMADSTAMEPVSLSAQE